MDSELLKFGSEDPDRPGDVIFIHGLDGNPLLTWKNPDTGLVWPEAVAEALPTLGVWSLGYNVASSHWRGTAMPLVERAVNTIALLEANGIGHRSLAFIGHSMGGLLAKTILRQALDSGDSRWMALAHNVRAIAFLATPHSGSGLADWCKRFTIVARATVAMDDLVAHEPHLRALNVWFRNKLPALNLATQVYYEKLSTAGVLVVDETSADPGVAGVTPIPLDADHAGICKPETNTHLVFRRVQALLSQALLDDLPAGNIPAPDSRTGGDPAPALDRDEDDFALQTGETVQDGAPFDGAVQRDPLYRLEEIALSLRAGAKGGDLVKSFSEFTRLTQGFVRQLAAMAEAFPDRLELEPIALSLRHICAEVIERIPEAGRASDMSDFFVKVRQKLRTAMAQAEVALKRFASAREFAWESEAEIFLFDAPPEPQSDRAEIEALIRAFCSGDALELTDAAVRVVGRTRDGFLARVAELPLIQREFVVLGLWQYSDTLLLEGRARARQVFEFAGANMLDAGISRAWRLLCEAFNRTDFAQIKVEQLEQAASTLSAADVRVFGRCLMLHPRDDIRSFALGLIQPSDCWALVVNTDIPFNWLATIWKYLKTRISPGSLKIFFICTAERLEQPIPTHHLPCAVELIRGFFGVNEFHEDECFRRLNHLRKHLQQQARGHGLLLDFDAEFTERLAEFLRKGASLLTLSETWRTVPLPMQRAVARRGLFLRFFVCHPVDKIAFETLPHLMIRDAIIELVALPRVNPRLLTKISKSRRLMAQEEVRYAVVRNPKASSTVVGSLIRGLRRDHLKQLAMSKDCNGAAREFARRILEGHGGA